MVLKEYTKKRADIVNMLSVPDIQKPYPIKIMWVNLMDSKTTKTGIFPNKHSHSFFEVHFVLSGKICYSTKSKEYTLSTGEAVIFSPKNEHSFVDKSTPFFKASVTFEADNDSVLHKKLMQISEKSFVYEDRIKSALDTILKEADAKTPFSPYVIQSRLLEMIYSVTTSLELDLPTLMLESKDTDPRFRVAKEYIDKNLSKQISCEEVASVAGLSVKHLNRIFTKHTDKSLFAYITAVRLKRAEHLLVNTRISIKEISSMLGFENEYSFNRFFKKHIGMPPGFYRKNN